MTRRWESVTSQRAGGQPTISVEDGALSHNRLQQGAACSGATPAAAGGGGGGGGGGLQSQKSDAVWGRRINRQQPQIAPIPYKRSPQRRRREGRSGATCSTAFRGATRSAAGIDREPFPRRNAQTCNVRKRNLNKKGANAPSQQTSLSKGHCRLAAHNDVIQRAHLHQRQRIFKPCRNRHIRVTRLGIATRMVVRENHCRCIES